LDILANIGPPQLPKFEKSITNAGPNVTLPRHRGDLAEAAREALMRHREMEAA